MPIDPRHHRAHMQRASAHNKKGKTRRAYNITYKKKSNGRTTKRKIEPLGVKGKVVTAFDHKRQALRSFHLGGIKHMEKAAFWAGFEKGADVSKEELKEELQKHEDRETPEQESEESEHEQEVEAKAGIHEKKALNTSALRPMLRHTLEGPVGSALAGAGVGGAMGAALPFPGKKRSKSARDEALVGAAFGGLMHAATKFASYEGATFFSGFAKQARKLTTKARNGLDEGQFALPGRRYPIHDENHGRAALSMVAKHGTPAEQAQVRRAVHAKYPHIGEGS